MAEHLSKWSHVVNTPATVAKRVWEPLGADLVSSGHDQLLRITLFMLPLL